MVKPAGRREQPIQISCRERGARWEVGDRSPLGGEELGEP